MTAKNIDTIMAELAKYNNMADEISGIIDGLRDQLKTYMLENNMDTLTGSEHKATYKTVTTNRLDTTAIKKEMPEIAARYMVTSESMRFNFS